MKSNLAEQQTPPHQDAPRPDERACDQVFVYKMAGAAFDLIEKHKTPPEPITYSLWYSYASKSPVAVSEEVDALLQDSGEITALDIESIYNAHLSNPHLSDASEKMGQQIETSLSDFTSIISKTNSQNEAFKVQLDDVGTQITDNPTPEDVSSIFERLVDTNSQMTKMTETLSAEIEKSQEQVRKLNAEFESLKKQTLSDALTGVSNRRAYDDKLASAFEDAEQNDTTFSLALFDVDKFKSINDTYGHPVGDKVLKALAELIQKNVDDTDFVARIGGDEFAVIFPGKTAQDAYYSLVAVKHQLDRMDVSEELSRESRHPVSFSCGMSEFKPERTLEKIVEVADSALYKAKGKKRSHISIEGKN